MIGESIQRVVERFGTIKKRVRKECRRSTQRVVERLRIKKGIENLFG